MQTSELLGLKIKEIRKQKHITQEELAEMVNLDMGYISKLEVGRNFPKIGTLEKIAEVLHVDLADFFKFSPTKEENFKEEILNIYDKLSKDKQYTLYRVAKGLM